MPKLSPMTWMMDMVWPIPASVLVLERDMSGYQQCFVVSRKGEDYGYTVVKCTRL